MPRKSVAPFFGAADENRLTTYINAAKAMGSTRLNRLLRRTMSDFGMQTAGELGCHRVNVVLGLLKNGADLNDRDDLGWNAFHHAARYADLVVMNELLPSCSNLDEKTFDGMTMLHLAVRSSPHIMNRLLRNKVSVDAKDKDGKTPLRYAVEFVGIVKKNAIVRALVKAGADPFLKDKTGISPYDYAKEIASRKGSVSRRRSMRSFLKLASSVKSKPQ